MNMVFIVIAVHSNVDTITHIVPQSELVREVDSDLSEADMIDIHRMIAEEERRIKWAEEHPGVPIPISPTPGSGTAMRPVVVPSVVQSAYPISAKQSQGTAPVPAMGTFAPTFTTGRFHSRPAYAFIPNQPVLDRPQTIPMTMLPQTVNQGTPQRYTSHLSMPISINSAGPSIASTTSKMQNMQRVVQSSNFTGDPNHPPMTGNNAFGIRTNAGQQPLFYQPPASPTHPNQFPDGTQNRQVGSSLFSGLGANKYINNNGPQTQSIRQEQGHVVELPRPQPASVARPGTVSDTAAIVYPETPAPANLPMDSFRSAIQQHRNGQSDPRGRNQ
jgi:hypothetical protein